MHDLFDKENPGFGLTDYSDSISENIPKSYAMILLSELLSGFEELKLPYEIKESNSSWHLFIIRLELSKLKATRKEIFEALRSENIGVNVHYVPVYLHPYYKKLGYTKGLCPVAEEIYECSITLPLFPLMTIEDTESVCVALKKIIEHYKL